MTEMYWEEPLKRKRPSIHVICTGGGAGLVEMLFRPPGASVYLSGASFPYASHELEEILGYAPKSACSPEIAADLACMAYMHAFGKDPARAIGLGLTAAAATNRLHRAGQRVHACVVSRAGVFAASMEFEPSVGQGSRMDDSKTCDHLAMRLILRAVGVEIDYRPLGWTFPRNRPEPPSPEPAHPEPADEFVLLQLLEHPAFFADGRRISLSEFCPKILMPGSFDPPHFGHYCLADEIEHQFGHQVAFQISVDPPFGHKSPPTLCNVLERIHLLQGRALLVTKGDPLFIDKARKFPGVAFAIGSDALVRLLDPVWGPPIEPMLAELERLNTKFYVAGRLSTDGVFLRPEDVSIPSKYRSMFITVPGRWDVSSSHIRFTKEESHED